jgi:CubicO group peptidase (beta-lactamase class C family)
MILVEENKLRLDELVDWLLPELADRQVLRRIDGPLDDTVPAHRSITLCNLLTSRMGIGVIMAYPGHLPDSDGYRRGGTLFRATPPALSPDEWMKRLGSLPLVYQPGEQWMYHNGCDVTSVRGFLDFGLSGDRGPAIAS